MIIRKARGGTSLSGKLLSLAIAATLVASMAVPNVAAVASEVEGSENPEVATTASEHEAVTGAEDPDPDSVESAPSGPAETEPVETAEAGELPPEPAEPARAEPEETGALDVSEEAVSYEEPLVMSRLSTNVGRVAQTISGTCYVYCVNPGTTNNDGNLFDVTMPDGAVVRGHCIDFGIAYPANGYYEYSGTWNGSSYDITVNTRWAQPHPQCILGQPCQRVGNFTWAPKGSMELVKTSSNPGMTDGNPNYSYAGAVFAIYRSDGTYVTSITTGSDGRASASGLVYGEYYCVETAAPKGYALDQTPHWFTVDGGSVRVDVSDKPGNDPVDVLLHKVDPITGGEAQGAASLAGAEFTVKYYAGDYPAGVDPAEQGATPTRTWIMETDDNGYCYFGEGWKVTGDDFYYSSTGAITFPFGTVTIFESKAPEGYHLSTPEYPNSVFVQKITANGMVGEYVDQWNVHKFADQVKAAECYITKIGTKIGDSVTEGDQAQAIPLPGVEFGLYASKDYTDNGDGTYTVRDGATPYATITTDENGIADTHYTYRPDAQHGALVYDEYLVVETKPAPNYDPIKPFTFKAHEDGKTYYFLANNTFVTSGVELVKVDSESGMPVLVAGTQLQVLDAAKNPIVWHETYPEEISYDTLTVGATGSVMLPQKLNAGSYYLHEVSAPEGYLLGHADVPFTVAVTTDWDNPLVVKYADAPQKGSIKIMKVDAETGEPVPAAGIEFEIVAASDIKTGDGVVHVPAGEVAARLATAADGTATAEDLYLGSYRIVETLAPEGYVLNGEPVDVTLSYAGQEVEAAYAESEFGDVPQKGVIDVTKVDAESGLPVAVPGIEFRVTAAADVVTPDGTVRAHEGDVVAEVVTGDDGKAETPELYLGRYEVEETLAPDGYVLNTEPVEVELSYAGQEVAVTRAGAVVEDAPQKGVIEIVKTDEADGRAVPGAVYEVAAAADIVTPDGTVHASVGDVVATVTTGDDGRAETDELYLSEYDVRETATPDGWAIDHETHKVVLAYAGQEVKVTRTVLETADAPTTFMLLKKAEQIDGELVDYEGSEWHVWAEDADGGIAYDATVTTGEDGSFVLERIPHGDGLTYYCQEVKTGDDYILDAEVYEFEVDEEGLIAGEPAYVLENVNYHKRIIVAHKQDAESGGPVSDTLFVLEHWDGAGKPVEAGGSDAEGEWVEVARLESDAAGDAMFEGLGWGWYHLVELYQNPDYMAPGESGFAGEFWLECSPASGIMQIQVVEDKPLTVETRVSKSTIAQTSAGLSYTDDAGNKVTNVDSEEYRYDVAFDSGATNVFADEYWVEDECQMTGSPYDLRIKRIVTPVVRGDTDGRLHVLVKTNKGGGSAEGMNFAQPELHPDYTLCDGTQRFDPAGYDYVGEYDATAPQVIDLSGRLSAGEYVTGIALCFGAVEVGFASTTPMSYMVAASHELDEGTVIPNTVTSHITRNWSSIRHTAEGDVPKDPSGPHDDAVDDVETTVVSTFETAFGRDLGNWGSGWAGRFARTGDPVGAYVIAMAAVAAVAGAVAFAGCRKKRRK